MLCAYTGTDARGYMDYLDAETSRMLQAVPGGIYEVTVAPGRAAGLPPVPGDGRWTQASEEQLLKAARQAQRMTSPAPLPGAAPEDPPEAPDSASPDSSIQSEECEPCPSADPR
jgi:hypothetical protein